MSTSENRHEQIHGAIQSIIGLKSLAGDFFFLFN
jgi:hypothetical protein